MNRVIKERNVALVYVFSLITFGIYYMVWSVKSKRDINALGGDIPTSWLLMVPFVNLYWCYKYADSFATHVKKNDSTLAYFFCMAFFGFVMPAIVQSELNKHAATPGHHEVEHKHAA